MSDIDEQIAALVALKASQQQPAAVQQAQAPQPAAPAITHESIADVVARTVAATMAAQQQAQPAPVATPRPPPAAAPSAPFSNGLPTHNGVVDIFQPGVADQLGPQGVREVLEKLWGIADDARGKPRRPKPPGGR